MSGGGGSLIMMLLVFVIMYFFMIRPQAKKQKELKKLRESLKPGDKVVTLGGVHGKVLEVSDSTILLSSDGTKIRFDKAAISHQIAD
jgi:preprotein translocase subunit YajC